MSDIHPINTSMHPNMHNDMEKGSVIHSDTFQRSPIQLSPEQYERLFVQPNAPAQSSLAFKFGNPTPLGIMSHLLCLTPTACYLMGWGGSSAGSLPSMVGAYYMIGGIGLILSGIMEWILGNTFPFVVFVTFGGFWASLGTLQDPMHAITSAFADGASSVAYNKGLMFYFSFWAATCFVYLIASLRTNAIFVFIFATLVGTFIFLAAAYAKIGDADVALATTLLKVSGSFAWACICSAWYLVLALMFASVDMRWQMPLGDMSGMLGKKRNA